MIRAMRGEYFILGTLVFEAFFPAIIHTASGSLPPYAFSAISVLIAAAIHAAVAMSLGVFKMPRRETLRDIGMIALMIVVFPTLFYMAGTGITSGINTSILLQSEVLFAVFFGWLVGERLLGREWLGLLAMVTGMVLVLWNGSFTVNLGDALIITASFFYPIGNWYAKRALMHAHPSVVLFGRSLLGGVALLVIATFVEKPWSVPFTTYADYWWLFAAYILVVLVFSKYCWYAGLKRLTVVKATSMIAAVPVMSFLLTVLLLRETPTSFQLLGISCTAIGVFLAVRGRKSMVVDQ